MMTKADLDKVVEETKSLKARVEAAESKAQTLEDEKATWISSKGYTPAGNRSDSDESRALRYFGCSHPKQLLDVNTADEKFSRVPGELKHLVMNFKKAIDVGRFISQRFRGDALDHVGETEAQDRVAPCRAILETNWGKNVIAPAIKAFGSTVSGGGDEWVPTASSSSYIPEWELEKALESKFLLVNMPTNPFDMPKISGVTKARIATENTAMTGANFTSDKISMSCQKLSEYYIIPEELSEDSAPDFLAAGRDEVVEAQKRAAESAIISGDDDGTHIDSDTQAGAADLAEKAWSGLRKLALANSATISFTGAGITEAKLSSMRAKGGKFFVDPANLLWVVGPNAYIQMLSLPNVATLDKFGPHASIISGSLGSYQGISIISSGQYREDLNATGVYDGITTNLTSVLLVNKKRFYMGQRRPIKVKLMPDLPSQDRWLLASYRRVTFKGHTQSAGEMSVVYGINIAKS